MNTGLGIGFLNAAQQNWGNVFNQIAPREALWHSRISNAIQNQIEDRLYMEHQRRLRALDEATPDTDVLDPMQETASSSQYDPALDPNVRTSQHLLYGGDWPMGSSSLMAELDQVEPMQAIRSGSRRSATRRYFGD